MPGVATTTTIPRNDAGMDFNGVDGRLRTWLLSLLRQVVEHLLKPCRAFRPTALLFLLPSFLNRLLRGDTVTGTLICPHHHKVSLCLQSHPSAPPLILLDLPFSTPDFAAQIRAGGCRIAFECRGPPTELPLLEGAGAWAVFLNGRRAGFASRRPVAELETRLLEAMRSVSAGAGVLPLAVEAASAKTEVLASSPSSATEMGRCKYLRGNFERVVGSAESESYHLVDPDGRLGQELSLFFLRRW